MSETANKENKNIDFESAMKRLDEITNQLSREGVSLDKALALYEEGVNLARLCNDKLDETDRKIKCKCNHIKSRTPSASKDPHYLLFQINIKVFP